MKKAKDPLEGNDEAQRQRLVWFLIPGSVWMVGFIVAGNALYFAFIGLPGLVAFWMVAHMVAVTQAGNMKQVARKNQELREERERLEFEAKMKDLERDGEKQATLSKAAQSKQELIMRLGSIDQYVRVVAIETDVSKRTVALQAAHSEMTTLAAKLASDQISRDALDAPEIREHATETSRDLSRLGLSDDRLNRDIVRMFKLDPNR